MQNTFFDRFYGIGSCESGGVTRLGYTEVEDEMHRALCELGDEKGYGHFPTRWETPPVPLQHGRALPVDRLPWIR